jgi:hypothetical protein
VVPLYCRKPATKGRRLLCAAADASLLPYVHSVSPCAPQSGFLAPARLLPGLFLAAAQLLWRAASSRHQRGCRVVVAVVVVAGEAAAWAGTITEPA